MDSKFARGVFAVAASIAVCQAMASLSHAGIPLDATKSAAFLNSLEGEYRLDKQDMGIPCRGFSEELKKDARYRLVVAQKAENDDYGKKGRVDVRLEAYYPNQREPNAPGEWGTAIESARFLGVDQGTERDYVPVAVGALITRETRTFSKPVKQIEARVKISAIEMKRDEGFQYGNSVATSTLTWDEKSQRLSYFYSIQSSKNGTFEGTTPYQGCTFVRVK